MSSMLLHTKLTSEMAVGVNNDFNIIFKFHLDKVIESRRSISVE